jgi:broad specificity phosphatase PhoE
MTRHYKSMASQTLDAVLRLHQEGINKISIIIRHSERLFTDDPNMEPFMPLTPAGRSLAFDFGKALPATLSPICFSSHIGRCIETAYLIDKGFITQHGIATPHPQTRDEFAPFYIKDINRVISLLEDYKERHFIEKWFDNQFDTETIDDPGKTAGTLCNAMITRLDQLEDNQMAVCVSHDWNLYPLKEFKLNQPLEDSDSVGYLEGVLFFSHKGKKYISGITPDDSPIAL